MIYAITRNGSSVIIKDIATANTSASYGNCSIHITSSYAVSGTYADDRNWVLEKGAILLATDATFPNLEMKPGSIIDVSGAVTFCGSFKADASTHFSGSGDIKFSSPVVPEKLFAEWWGAIVNDSTVDNAIAINKAIRASRVVYYGHSYPGCIPIMLSAGQYWCRSTLKLYDGTSGIIGASLVGAGSEQTTIVPYSINGWGVTPAIETSNVGACKLQGFSIATDVVTSPVLANCAPIGILQIAQHTGSTYGVVGSDKDISIRLVSNPTANSGLGCIGILNFAAEEHMFDCVAITADAPLILSGQSDIGGIQSGATPIPVVDFSTIEGITPANFSEGVYTLKHVRLLSTRQSALILQGTNNVRGDLYIHGTGTLVTDYGVQLIASNHNHNLRGMIEGFKGAITNNGYTVNMQSNCVDTKFNFGLSATNATICPFDLTDKWTTTVQAATYAGNLWTVTYSGANERRSMFKSGLTSLSALCTSNVIKSFNILNTDTDAANWGNNYVKFNAGFTCTWNNIVDIVSGGLNSGMHAMTGLIDGNELDYTNITSAPTSGLTPLNNYTKNVNLIRFIKRDPIDLATGDISPATTLSYQYGRVDVAAVLSVYDSTHRVDVPITAWFTYTRAIGATIGSSDTTKSAVTYATGTPTGDTGTISGISLINVVVNNTPDGELLMVASVGITTCPAGCTVMLNGVRANTTNSVGKLFDIAVIAY